MSAPSKEARDWYYANTREKGLPREPSENLLEAFDAFAAEAVKAERERGCEKMIQMVREEREACAQIAAMAEYSLKVHHNISFTARGPAADIRARGK